ncbi:long-chain-fatty-acid--CoA ligase [Burkholderia alba]|uniref:long-chain-fatty-acid--CoA ligase n=1 Tax=Burkholderia alba TaxID=2683677 RepID=UPI002B056D20|nr:long-chain-fatty-acid--CoA ligase [Burkholderia alba]
MHLTQSLHKALRERPDATAVVCGARRATFRQFAERAARLAAALRKLGMRPGDRVGMLSLNSVRYVEYLYGVWWGGGVINPVNIRWSAREVAYSLDDCDTRILLVDACFSAQAGALRELSGSLRTLVYCGDDEVPAGMVGYEQIMAESDAMDDAWRGGDDLAAVMYTGGTTGTPKGVMLSHANLYVNALSAVAAVPRPEGEKVGLVVAPFFHVAGCGLSLQMMQRLMTQVVVPVFDEVAVLRSIHGEGVTETFLVPTMIKRLVEHARFAEFDLGSLRMMFYGAAPIDATLLAQAMQALPRVEFCQVYGMTELAPTISVLLPTDHRPGLDQAKRLRSAGRPVPIAEVRIVDDAGRELPPGAVGEICARGPMVMQGYWNKPEETAAVLRDGWMHTGDGGYRDAEGYLYVVDRLKDMIVTGGENVYSAEVENAIAQLPQVSMCAVIGVPDDQWGERVHAVIVLRPGTALDELGVITHCRGLVAGYKCPRSIEFRNELPLSPAGKLQKFILREPFWAGHDRRIN